MYMHIYIYIERERENISLSLSLSLYIYIYIHTYIYREREVYMAPYSNVDVIGVFDPADKSFAVIDIQDSSKGGAVETGCSDLYDVIY